MSSTLVCAWLWLCGGFQVQVAPSTYASCCVNVQGLDRHVFLVPRETKLGTSTPVAFGDMYEELKV